MPSVLAYLTLARCHDESVLGGLWPRTTSNFALAYMAYICLHGFTWQVYFWPGGDSKLWLRLAANGTKEKTIKGMKPIAIEVQPMTMLQVAIQ